jgi:tetratricopeptide (TPR) repeat protein
MELAMSRKNETIERSSRKLGNRCSLALAAMLLSSCSIPALFTTETPANRGAVSPLADGGVTSPMYEKGKAHFNAGQLGLAVNEFQAARAETPGSVEILNGLAATYDRLGRFDLADRYYKEAVALDPKNAQTLNNIAYSLILRGDPKHAIPLLDLAKGETPSEPVVEANLQLAKSLNEMVNRPQTAELKDVDEQERSQRTGLHNDTSSSTQIERRSEGVQELVIKGGSEANATTAQRVSGIPPLFIPLPPAPAATVRSASTSKAVTTAHAISVSYIAPVAVGDGERVVAAPLVPVHQARLGELKPTPDTQRAALNRGEPQPPSTIEARSKDGVDNPPIVPAESSTRTPRSEDPLPVQVALARTGLIPDATPRTRVSRPSADAPQARSACAIEISNGAGKTGMAARFRAFAEGQGLVVRLLTNDRSFSRAKTIVYYRKGSEDSARKIASLLSKRVSLEPAASGRCDVRVRLGRDLLGFYQALGRRSAAKSAS